MTDAEQLKTLLSDQLWRLSNLYWITDKAGRTVRFKPNWAQLELYKTKHLRNNILKVRQLGISTFVSMLILDSCLFTHNFKAGIVDRTLPDAKAKLEKIKFAFERLDHIPENPTPLDLALATIGADIKKKAENTDIGAEDATFFNGSRIYVGATLRGGTLQLLHVSELGSISKKFPQRAKEIRSGCQETVGLECLIFFESTHEGGKSGTNYEMVEEAMSRIGKPLTPLDSKFYFFPWYNHPEYELTGWKPEPTADQQKYFEQLEARIGSPLSDAKKAWYLGKCRALRSLVKQEYPSTPEEALNNLTDGTIYSTQLFDLMERGHLEAQFEPDPHLPIFASWDIGIADYMSIWWVQPSGNGKWLILDNYTASNQPISHYLDIMREHDARWSRATACVLPHDATRRDFQFNTFEQSIRAAGYSTILVPRTNNLWASIDNTRELLETSIIHARCSEFSNCAGRRYPSGVDSLKDYHLADPGPSGSLAPMPVHDTSSHACDALRTFADAVHHGLINPHRGWATEPSSHKKRNPRALISSRLR